MKISVVIPVLNEGKRLRACLKALSENEEQPYEIIIADGGSTDDTMDIAKKFGVKIIKNNKGHAAGGRNAGIKAAKGDIVAFTDGDCIPALDWIKNIQTIFESKKIDGIGGFVEPAKPENEYEQFWGELSLKGIMTYGSIPYEVHQRTLNDAFITANCAYTRKLLVELRGFNNWFANNAEDVDLSWRALERGAVLWYEPSVRVEAHSPLTMRDIRKKSFRNGYSSSKLQRVYGTFINYDVSLYRLLFMNIRKALMREEKAWWMVQELIWHLAGKYYGSIKTGIINI